MRSATPFRRIFWTAISSTSNRSAQLPATSKTNWTSHSAILTTICNQLWLRCSHLCDFLCLFAAKMKELDFSDFPPGTVTDYTTLVCLACIFDIFTRQIGLAPRSAYSEIKRYSPTIEELTSR